MQLIVESRLIKIAHKKPI